MMRSALTCIILLGAISLRAEVKTVSFSDMAAYHVRAVAHLEPLPLGLGASVVTVAQGPVRFDDPVYSLTKKITSVEPIVEPVCSEEKTVGDDKYIYNPSCLVNDGRSAWFKAAWNEN